MGNLARNLQEQHVEQTVQEDRRQIKIRKSWLTPGEKIIGVTFAGLVCFGAIHLISNESKIYDVNKDIQTVQDKVKEQQKENSDLQVQVSDLSNYQRIYEKAKEMGLQVNENNVKVVQGK
ncbi:cell division protein FtsL [Bacillus sp. BRMEA1]|uniref:cell division protein FtsL n=1 Tax=Neobacillus endophyticus TaxID=2738405 RepID=UPI0015645E82|nr:cell division protein FtsL [Neobacillus endophyticus]NRD78777.1 cell division protein FtsL [Neobacillus endophyticus]